MAAGQESHNNTPPASLNINESLVITHVETSFSARFLKDQARICSSQLHICYLIHLETLANQVLSPTHYVKHRTDTRPTPDSKAPQDITGENK